MGELSVLLCTEGTYPFVEGGVSTWCDILCRRLAEVDFTLYAVTGSAEVAYRFTPPPNAARLVHVPLWGAQDPAAYVLSDVPAGELRSRRRGTTDEAIEREFVPLLHRLLAGIDADELESEHAALPHDLWRYFRAHDWRATWKAEPVWRTFVEDTLGRTEARSDELLPGEQPTVHDLSTAMRWLSNFLLPLAAPVADVDLVHSTIASFASLPGIVAKLERGTPFLVTEHGVAVRERYIAVAGAGFEPFAKRFLNRLAGFVARLAYHHADLVAPVTNYNQRWELRFGAEASKLRTIPNGVDPEVFAPGPRRGSGRPTVVGAGRVYPLKDIETMIRAAAVVRRSVPNVRFVQYGATDADPPYTERCRRLIRELGLQGTFELGGNHPNPAQLYLEGDVTALSSISEAFPYTVLESMACSRPVVGTDVGGVKEALEGFGVVVPPRDPEALAAGVVRLLEDDELRLELGRRAREEILARYRVSNVVEAYLESYRSLSRVRAAA